MASSSTVLSSKRKRDDGAQDDVLKPVKLGSSSSSLNGSEPSSSSSLSVGFSAITGDALTLPTPASASMSSSLPPSLPSSVLPLPFTSPAGASGASSSSSSSSSAALADTTNPSPIEPSTALVALVDQYAHRLHLPPPHARLTLTLVSALVSQSASCTLPLHVNTSTNHVPWIACCIWYSLLVLSPVPALPPSASLAPAPRSPSSPSFTHILITCALPLPVFLRHLDHLSSHLQESVAGLGLPAVGLKERVDAFEGSLLMRVALYKKFEKLYAQTVDPEMKESEEQQSGAPVQESGGWRSTDVYGCGWLLYLAVKSESKKADAHSQYLQLLAVCSLMLSAVLHEKTIHERSSPREQAAPNRKNVLEVSRRLVCTQDGQADPVLISAVAQFHDEWLQRFLVELRDGGAVSYTAHQSDIFSPAQLQSNITTLGHVLDSRPSDDSYYELDERLFLMETFTHPEAGKADDDGRSGGKGAASHRRLFADSDGLNGATTSSVPMPPSCSPLHGLSSSSVLYTTPMKLNSSAQPHHAFSPSLRTYPSSQASRTPITRMMEAVSWLTSTFTALTSSPSPAVRRYFSSLQPDPLAKLLTLLSTLSCKVVIHDLSSPSASSHTKRELALKIYWFVIEQLVPSSSPSTEKAAPPAWLVSRNFHSALLCICFELIFHAYRHTLMCFPHLLPLFGLTYFEYLKVVDTALKRLPTLPSSLRLHLCEVEVSIVEQGAWSKGEKAVEMMKDEATRARVELILQHAISNGGKDRRDGEEKGDAHITAASHGSPDFSALLTLYRKLCSLCAERLAYLSSDLALSLSTRHQQATWTLLTHVLLAYPSLLFHRHVDTLLLCSLYTVNVKICHAELDFKRIVHVYLARWEAHATDVVREVEGRTEDSPKLTIIAYYNEVFIPRVKDFALGTLQPILLAPLTSPSLPSLSPLPTRSRHTPISSHPNIFMSPLRPNAQQSPQQRVLSAVVGESPTKRLAEMNAMLEGKGGRRAGMSGSKALFREDGLKRGMERDGVEALLLASRVNGHRDSDE